MRGGEPEDPASEGDVLESVLRHAPAFLAHITRDGRFLFLNRFATGLGPNDLEGRTLYDFVAPEDHPKIRDAISRTLATRVAQEYETTGVGPDRKPAHYLARIAPVITAGEVQSLVVIATDVTRLKELEANLYHSMRLESLSRLSGGVARDFGNALAAILSSVSEITGSLPADTPGLKKLYEACEAARRSIALTNQLATFARRQAFEPRVIDLNSVLREIDELLRHVVGTDIEIVVELAAQRTIRGDQIQLEQAVLALASRARDAIMTGGVLGIRTSDVEIAAPTPIGRRMIPGWYVKLAISDTGRGIDREQLDRLFEPFYLTDGGLAEGLELPMVHGIVTRHGGHITVSSEPGRGTVFEILLPGAVAETPASEDRAAGSETILIVEDEQLVRSSLVKALKRAGYQVLEAGNGVEALARARAYPGKIHMLLTDLVMPEMGGIELERRLTSERPGLACQFMSGYADERHGLLDVDVDLLSKPFSISVLLRRIRQRLVKG